MSNKTKAFNLTEEEGKALIEWHGYKLSNNDASDRIERLNYLQKRLKAFTEPETTFEKVDSQRPNINPDTDALNPENQQIKSSNSTAGWGEPNNG